jgi:hypothetical protein
LRQILIFASVDQSEADSNFFIQLMAQPNLLPNFDNKNSTTDGAIPIRLRPTKTNKTLNMTEGYS